MKGQIVTFTVEDKAVFGNEIMGFVKLDLFSVATGCENYRMPGMKVKKGNTIGNAKWTIEFSIQMKCISDVEIQLSEMECKRLRNAGLSNPLFEGWKSDPYLQINLYELNNEGTISNTPISTVRSSVCYNTSYPTWLSVPSLFYRGTIMDILHLVLEIRVIEHRTNTLLGSCFINISQYYSLNESEKPVILDLFYMNAPYGEFDGFLTLKNMPPYCQMLHGKREADKILDAHPIVSEAPQPPKKLVMLKLKEPIFESPKVGEKELALSQPLGRQDVLLVKAVLRYVQDLKNNDVSKKVKAASEILKLAKEHENEFSLLFSKFGNLLDILMDFIKSSHKDLKINASKILSLACKNSKNVELVYVKGIGKDLLEILKNTKDSNVYYITSILVPLSIRDENTQSLFLKHSSIHILIDIMSRTKKVSFLKNIIQILGHLCYGSDVAKNNKEVIKNTDGLNLMIKTAYTHQKTFSTVLLTLKIFTYEDITNHKEVVKCIVTHIYLNLKDHDIIVLLMTLYNNLRSIATDTTEIDHIYISNISKVIIPFLSSKNEKLLELCKNIIFDVSILSYADSMMWNDLSSAISSSNHKVQRNAMELSEKILTSFSNTHEIYQHLIISLIKMKTIPSLISLFTEVEDTNENANFFKQIISLLKVIFKHVLILHYKKEENLYVEDAQKLLTYLDGPFIQKFVSILKNDKRDIKVSALKFAATLSKYPLTNFVLVKSEIIEIFPELISGSNPFDIRKECLKFLSNFTTNCNKKIKKELSEKVRDTLDATLIESHIILCNYTLKIIKNLCVISFNRINDELLQHFIGNKIVEKVFNIMVKAIANKSLAPIVACLEFISMIMKIEEYSSLIEFDVVSEFIIKAQELSTHNDKDSTNLHSIIDLFGFIALCTKKSNNNEHLQEGFECRTCALTGKTLICVSCSKNCHLGHEIVPIFSREFSCKCGDTLICRSQKLRIKPHPLKVCTKEFGTEEKFQYAYKCRTCFLTNDNTFICGVCISTEHNNHFVQNSGVKKFTCNCYHRNMGCKLGYESALIEDTFNNNSSQVVENRQPQVEEEEEENICIVCFINKKDTAFYRCGHVACCHECANELRTRNSTCPICRQPIQDVMKLFEV